MNIMFLFCSNLNIRHKQNKGDDAPLTVFLIRTGSGSCKQAHRSCERGGDGQDKKGEDKDLFHQPGQAVQIADKVRQLCAFEQDFLSVPQHKQRFIFAFLPVFFDGEQGVFVRMPENRENRAVGDMVKRIITPVTVCHSGRIGRQNN